MTTTHERTVNGISIPPAGKYELDKAHTAVEFVARHMLTKVRGRFTRFDGWFEIAEAPEDSTLHVEIEATSIQTNTEQRDEHLRSGDFLLAEEYPILTFDSTAIRVGEGNDFEIDGDLTIRGITNPVTLAGEFHGWGPGTREGSTVAAFSAKTSIDREDWDITWNAVVETGGFLVGKRVDIEIEVEALRTG
jgi:polyisoprenoid-binding protein YceI